MRPRSLLVSSLLLGLVLSLVASPAAVAQKNKLSVGDAAPGLDIEEWVKGDATSIEKGRVYIVEFWATWCGPCRASMPHLTEMQENFGEKGLTIIGVTTEEADVVKPWLKKNGDKMGYTVAIDRRKGTDRAWHKAAGLRGIPAAFVVDRGGKIVFIGNPHPKSDGPEMERIVKKVLVGRYDPELEEKAAPLLKEARRARKTNTWRVALMQYDKVIEMSPSLFADVAMERFKMMLVDMEDRTVAYTYARTQLLQGSFATDELALRYMAKTIATDPEIGDEDRDLGLALEAAQAAMALSGGADPEPMATLALVHFHRGEVQEAIGLQRRAWMLARPKSKAGYKRVLRSYQDAAGRTAGLKRR